MFFHIFFTSLPNEPVKFDSDSVAAYSLHSDNRNDEYVCLSSRK